MKHILVFESSKLKDEELSIFWGFFLGQSMTMGNQVIQKLYENITEAIESEIVSRKLMTIEEVEIHKLAFRGQVLLHESKLFSVAMGVNDDLDEILNDQS